MQRKVSCSCVSAVSHIGRVNVVIYHHTHHLIQRLKILGPEVLPCNKGGVGHACV